MNIENTREYKYQGFTLVDITNTGVTKQSQEQMQERNQQRNWETVKQLLSLRTQVLTIDQQLIKKASMNKHEFGQNYTGQQSVWSFTFTVEFNEVFKSYDDPVGVLVTDFNQTPIILNLTETVSLPMPLFYTVGPSKNIYFIPLEHN